jgi:hypothetical protein
LPRLQKKRRVCRLGHQHLPYAGDIVFRHACEMGVEGIVSKRLGSRYRSERSPDWLKFKNPEAPAVRREAQEDCGGPSDAAWGKWSGTINALHGNDSVNAGAGNDIIIASKSDGLFDFYSGVLARPDDQAHVALHQRPLRCFGGRYSADAVQVAA